VLTHTGEIAGVRIGICVSRLAPVSKAAILAAALMIGGCGSQSIASRRDDGLAAVRGPGSLASTLAAPGRASHALLVEAPGQPGPRWKRVATIAGQPAAWIAQRAGVTLLRFDQRLVHLVLHAGSHEPGGRGWTHGDHIGRSEVHRALAAFNGGFKLSNGSVGFMADGRVAVALAAGLGSIVTYQNGTTQIGAWHEGVPTRRLTVASVLQNLHLLVDHGVAAPTVETCIRACWGLTLGGVSEVARSALGITGDRQLVWAAGEHLSPSTLARALIDAGIVRAVQLDINLKWIAGYLYLHHGGSPTAAPVVPGQHGIPGRFRTSYRRDFFTILAN
jgi:hypothetical protein